MDTCVDDAVLVSSFEYEDRHGRQDRALLFYRENSASMDLVRESGIGVEDPLFSPFGENNGEFAAIESASLYRDAGAVMVEANWTTPLADNSHVNFQLKRDRRESGEAMSADIACGLLREGVEEIQSRLPEETLKLQRAAFSAYGEVPGWALTPERLRERLREVDMGHRAKYAISDFLSMRWFRLALGAETSWKVQEIFERHERSGRARKSYARVPGGLSSHRFHWATENLSVVDEAPERRLTWLALSAEMGELAEAIRRASTYEIRKVTRLWREDTIERTNEDKQELYLHSEETAIRFLRWLADATRWEEENVSRRSSLQTWYRVSDRLHRERRQDRRQRRSKKVLRKNGFRLGPKAVSPPEGAEQLRQAIDVVEEGREMGHCVSSYADDVVQGRSLIFHYEAEGSEATVEIRPGNERHVQAFGPKNQPNAASRKAKEVFGEWIKGGIEMQGGRMDLGQASGALNTLPARRQVAELHS